MSEPTSTCTTECQPDLAIVVVTYNSASVIAECLASIPPALDGAGPVRLIVVDNASTDDTLTIVSAVAEDAQVVRRTNNGGFAAGVNAGISAAARHDVLVLNADIRLAPGSIASMRAATENSKVGIVVPKLIDTNGAVHASLRRSPTFLRAVAAAIIGGSRTGRFSFLGETIMDPRAYEKPHDVEWATGAAWLITAECIRVAGMLDERYFLYSEETEYMLRARRAGVRTRYEPGATAIHLGGDAQTSPRLRALLITNKVRLHRELRGGAAAASMWLALFCNEFLRGLRGGVVGRTPHWAALRSLLTMPHWPRDGQRTQ